MSTTVLELNETHMGKCRQGLLDVDTYGFLFIESFLGLLLPGPGAGLENGVVPGTVVGDTGRSGDPGACESNEVP